MPRNHRCVMLRKSRCEAYKFIFSLILLFTVTVHNNPSSDFSPLFHLQTLLILVYFGNPIIPIIFKSFPHQNLTLIPQNPSCPNLTQRSLKILFVSLVLRHIGQRKIRWFTVFQQFLHM